MRAPSYEYVLLHQFEVVFRDGEHKTQRATRDYQKVWENVIDNPPEEGVTPVLVYRMNGETCAVVAGMDELIGNEECAMEILRLSAAATAREKEVEELRAKLEGQQHFFNLATEEIASLRAKIAGVPVEEIERWMNGQWSTSRKVAIDRWLAGLGK